MTPSVAPIIVNYNAGAHLRTCLESLAATLQAVEWAGVVIDNASSDGSWKAADEFASRITVVRNGENVGFARAINQGLAATTGGLVLILNPDCRVMDGMVQTLATELDQHPNCALVGPRVLDPDGSVQGSARGDPTLMTGLFGRTSLLSRVFPSAAPARANIRTELAIRSGSRCIEVDWVSGACMLARRDALEQIQGFDERYFLYWEDADLCRRLRARGHRICYVPGARVVHMVGQSSRTARPLAVREFHRSAYRYYSTHVTHHPVHRGLAKLILGLSAWRQLLALRLKGALIDRVRRVCRSRRNPGR